jgi:hypothetical protein
MESLTRIELVALRLRCAAAFSAYQAQLTTVLQNSKGGQTPTAQDLHAEEQALYEYAKVRREFLDALESAEATNTESNLTQMRGRPELLR